MDTRKTLALGIAGGALAIAAPLGIAAAAYAATSTPAPSASSTTWPGGYGMGMGGPGRGGTMNGAGYGAGAVADYLAEKLGVSSDAVATALQQYHADNPMTAPGRTLSDADLAARQKAEADYLASALKVDASKVLAALTSFRDDRWADMTQEMNEHLDAMVRSGTLTQDQADAMRAAHDSGQRMMFGGPGGPGGPGGHWG